MKQDILTIYAGVDPGFTGGLTVLIGNSPVVYDPPIEKISVNGKVRSKYDLYKMHALLKQFEGQNVVFGIEKISLRPRESPIAALTAGQGYASWMMAAVSCGFKVIEFRSQEWKKFFPNLLASVEIEDLRKSIQELKDQNKDIKDRKQKNSMDKEISKLGLHLKGLAKDSARRYASELYPDLLDKFKLKKNDGRAESLLIAKYTKAHYR